MTPRRRSDFVLLFHRNSLCQCIGLLASTNASLEKFSFHRVAGHCKGPSKFFLGDIVLSVAKLKFSKCCEIERVVGETITVSNGVNFFESSCWTFMLTDRDGTFERYDRRRTNSH